VVQLVAHVIASNAMSCSSVGLKIQFQVMPAVKRICLGGRGREWVPECLKLLKIMSNLSDAKIFLEPVDPIKYAVSFILRLLGIR
jgi:hypothetical protein